MLDVSSSSGIAIASVAANCVASGVKRVVSKCALPDAPTLKASASLMVHASSMTKSIFRFCMAACKALLMAGMLS